MVDIHDELCLAVPAPEDQVFRLGTGLFTGLLVRDLLAVGTDIAPVLYDQFSMFRLDCNTPSLFSSLIPLYSKIVRARTRAFI